MLDTEDFEERLSRWVERYFVSDVERFNVYEAMLRVYYTDPDYWGRVGMSKLYEEAKGES